VAGGGQDRAVPGQRACEHVVLQFLQVPVAEPLTDDRPEAYDWVTGGSSGAFTYSYPVNVPPVPGSLEPEVSLEYDSQAIDGLTSSTNNEASWIEDGWDYSPGFIEADYPACSTVGIFAPDTSDLCFGGQMSLNGVTTPLVAGSSYHPEADGGQKVEKNGNSWEVIEPDGTQYYFGLNELPGYSAGDPTTNSVWTAPVYLGCADAVWGAVLDDVEFDIVAQSLASCQTVVRLSVCNAATHPNKPFPWQVLGIAGLTLLNILRAGGDPVTDAAELGDLTGGEAGPTS
jgi:hypothetical protein